jgi:hypothetical protein
LPMRVSIFILMRITIAIRRDSRNLRAQATSFAGFGLWDETLVIIGLVV